MENEVPRLMTPGKNSDPTRKHCNHIIILTNHYCLKLKPNINYTHIYISAFSRRFYPKRLTLHSSFHILSALAFPGNQTHDLGVASAMHIYLYIYIYIVISWIPGIMGPVPYTHLHRSRCQLSGSAQSHAAGFCAESPLRTGPADPCCRTAGFTTLMT